MMKKEVPRQNCLFKSLVKGLKFLTSSGFFLLLHIISPLFKRDELSECKGFNVMNMSCPIFHLSVTWLKMKARVTGSRCDSALQSLCREVPVCQNVHSRRSSKDQSQKHQRSAVEGVKRWCGSLEKQNFQENLNSCFVVPIYLSISSEISRILMET